MFGSAAASLGSWWPFRGAAAPSPAPPPDPELFQRPVATVKKLYFYPLKSGHRIEVDSFDCLMRGPAYDRTFVILNNRGQFLHQRRIPALAQIQPRLQAPPKGADGNTASRAGVTLYLTAPGMPELTVREPPPSTPTDLVRIWATYGEGVDVGDEAAAWISTFLRMDGCRMYYMSPAHKSRVLDDEESLPGDETSFADTAPVHLISEASVEKLNTKLETPLPIERFRPNIILNGCEAHDEDTWGQVRIGKSLIVRHYRKAPRCKMTTVDPEKGVFTGMEPLMTLRTYRIDKVDTRFGISPLFGSHYAVLNPGEVHVGDTIFAQ